jgi:chromosome segregation ATPase
MSEDQISNLDSDNQQDKKSNGAFIAIILLLLLALAAMAYLWSAKNTQLNDCANENLALKADMDGMNQMMSGYVDNMSSDLRKDFQNMLDTYDALMVKDKNQSDSIMAQKEKILGLMDDLTKNKKMTASQLFTLRKENETLRGIMKSYVMQIDSLNTLNLKLESNLQSTKTQLNSTTNERDQYKQVAEENAEQVKKGARLQAYNFVSGGLKMKLNNTTDETNRARNTVQIKSSFTLSENPLTKPGNKTVYLQIIDPTGKTLQVKSSNVVELDNGTIAYSDKKDVDYQNKRLDLSIFYDFRGEDAAKGNYKVNVYCDSALIGTDSFTLK